MENINDDNVTLKSKKKEDILQCGSDEFTTCYLCKRKGKKLEWQVLEYH